ncbi:uncharacterized protein LOC109254343 [Panthera pardus]|uniref:Uncharacterized protein LOC109254343 n=1 Tax=Panthera pardus TaxID=9691 RepID=A0A9V1EKK8_PANPR|nr:uncharacterized protein LOC109254343 [Panthera pardus]
MGTEQETPRPRDGHASEPALRSQSSPRAPPGRPRTSARGSEVPGSLGPRPRRFLEGACPGSAGRTAGVSRCAAAAPCGASRVQPVPSPAWRALSAPGLLSARAKTLARDLPAPVPSDSTPQPGPLSPTAPQPRPSSGPDPSALPRPPDSPSTRGPAAPSAAAHPDTDLRRHPAPASRRPTRAPQAAA